jgi:hypothetical protein
MRFDMMDSKSMVTTIETNLKKLSDPTSDLDLVDPTMYMKLIGSLMYWVNTRPYICFAVSTLSQFIVDSKHYHWDAKNHVLMYLHSIVGYGLIYVSCGEVKPQIYTHSD